MIKKILIAAAIMAVSCRGGQSDAALYLSNVSLDGFDRSIFRIFINDKLILSDSIKNQYVSSHWKESKIIIPKGSFNFRVAINGNGYKLEKDTTVSYSDSLKLFVRFNFYPYYKRYRNPDIYKFLPGETTRLKEIADSLYANNLLPNASEYLNDTIPFRKNIEIVIK